MEADEPTATMITDGLHAHLRDPSSSPASHVRSEESRKGHGDGGSDDQERQLEEDLQNLTQQTLLNFTKSCVVASSNDGPGRFVPKPGVFQLLAGYGRAPWEIHRPQKAIIQLAKQGGFRGTVLDIGCGIGDNALFVARCEGVTVTAFDVVDRCINFGKLKASIRGVNSVQWCVGDVLLMEGECLSPGTKYDVLLDSGAFQIWNDTDRNVYLQNLAQLAHSGTMLYILAISEKDTAIMPPRKYSQEDLRSLFCEASGWEVLSIEETVFETHPNFMGGRREANLLAARRL